MDSSTSHSDHPSQRLPLNALLLLATAVTTWIVGAVYTLRWNPEVRFLRHAHLLKEEWNRHIRTSPTPKTVVYGGSSCLTSIDPTLLLRSHGIPVVNMGMGAGMGARVLTSYAMSILKSGDRLVIALEPGLLGGPVDLEPLGVHFALSVNRPDLLEKRGRVDWPSVLLDLRPGGYHVLTLMGKVLLRQPLHRYATNELQEGGWHKVPIQRDLGSPDVPRIQLSASGRALLEEVAESCRSRGIQVALTLPWQFSAAERLEATRLAHLDFLSEVSGIIPVLSEPELGCHGVRENYADTILHPTAEGARLRTEAFGRAISQWQTWQRSQLESMRRP